MATSERRIEANKKNAMLAKGPVSAKGKENSRKNSLKHGLTGKGVVRPAEEEKEVAERTAKWVEIFQPKDEFEHELLDRTIRAGVRRDRAAEMESARRVELAGRALSSWAEDRRLEAEELAGRLAKKPSLVARKLRRTLQGCELLLDRWYGLLRVAEAGTAWDDAQRSRALDLLGVPLEDRQHHPLVHDKATAADLLAVARDEIEHLEGRRAAYLDDEDESDRLLAEAGLAFDDSPTGRRLWSYERANDRIYQRGLDELNRRRRSRTLPAAPAPTSPRPRPEPAPAASATLDLLSKLRSMTSPADGPRSAPATTTADPAPVAAPAPKSPSISPAPAPLTGNRRDRRAQQALARRRA